MDSEISIWLLCGSGSPEGRLGQTPGKRTEPRERPAAPSLSPVLQAGPDFISRCGPRIASAAASLPATAFVTCPAVQAPTSWTVPHGGLWAAGGSSWHEPSWVVGLSCYMGTPSTVGPTAIACIQPLVAPCTWTWACCCATLTAMAWNAEAPASSAQPHPWAPVRGRMGSGACLTRPGRGLGQLLSGRHRKPSTSPSELRFPICEMGAASVWVPGVWGEEAASHMEVPNKVQF